VEENVRISLHFFWFSIELSHATTWATHWELQLASLDGIIHDALESTNAGKNGPRSTEVCVNLCRWSGF